MSSSRLDAEARQRALDALRRSAADGPPFDVLVIGGGITGAGVALDASSRGLTTAIVEARDWASGTSSKSSKLVHGGLRYLRMLDFWLVREALRERDLLLTAVAPHLVSPLRFTYPLRHGILERLFVGAGVALYDVLATLRTSPRALPWHRHVGGRQLLASFPGLATARMGAVQYWDATVDDARLVVDVVRTAVASGTQAASRTEAVAITRDEAGHANGALLRDTETGTEFEVRARSVIAAVGIWTGTFQKLAEVTEGLRVRASKGAHIVVPRDRIDGDSAVVVETRQSVLFLIPWPDHWVIGTTDTDWKLGDVEPFASHRDVDFILREANKILTRPLVEADIVSTWAGLRPLMDPGPSGLASSKVSREHTLGSPVHGLTVIAGGKLTSYRVMAKDAVDFALGRTARRVPSRTHLLPLVGAVKLAKARTTVAEAAQSMGWPSSTVDLLLGRYGAGAVDILAICAMHPLMAQSLEHAPEYLRAEIVYAVTRDGALHLDDVLVRRTRISREQRDGGAAAAAEVASIAGSVLGWSSATERAEVQSFLARAVFERQSARTDDDATLPATEEFPTTRAIPEARGQHRGMSGPPQATH